MFGNSGIARIGWVGTGAGPGPAGRTRGLGGGRIASKDCANAALERASDVDVGVWGAVSSADPAPTGARLDGSPCEVGGAWEPE